MKLIVSLTFLCLSSTWAFAVDEPPTPVKAELLSDVEEVKPGEEFRLGVLFRIDPGWHIYWKNPGDTGLPTSTQFDLPDGFVVGKLNWPIPTRFTRSGHIVDFGYEDSLLLTTVVKAPAELKKDSSIPIGAEVSWLSCQEVCIPGQARLELMFPVTEAAETENPGLFAEWERRLPVDPAPGTNPFVWKVTRVVDEGEQSSRYTVLLDWYSYPGRTEWFPVPESALEIENISLETKDGQTRLTFDAKMLSGQKLSSDVLESVVSYTTKEGERKGVNLAIKLNE